MMFANGIMRLDRRQEVRGHKFGSLMDQLIEGVLSIGSWFAPDDRSGGVVGNPVAAAIHALAVALHLALLEVGREAVHILIVGQDSHGLRAKEVVVPDPDQAQNDRQVLLKRRGAKMLVHLER